jgi:DNA-binding IclR family transcriptional regulator
MKSLTNGLTCLRLLARFDGVLQIANVCEELALPRSSAYRLVATLVNEGFLRPGPETGKYVGGSELLALGSVVLDRMDVRQVALPHMHRLSEATTHSVYLMIQSGFEAVCIEVVSGNDGLRLDVHLGTRRQLHCSGIAKVFLPVLSETEIDRLSRDKPLRFTDETTQDWNEIRREIEEIKRSGYAVSSGEFVAGARSLGVPIKNYQGRTIAALGIGGSQQKLSDAILPHVIGEMTKAAEAISVEIGFNPAADRTRKASGTRVMA